MGETTVVMHMLRGSDLLIGHVRPARTIWARTKGLLGRGGLDPDEGLWIDPCSSIHTHFMRFTMDAVFLDRELRVTRVVHRMRPWRVAGGGRGAHSVVELAAGAAERAGIEAGQQLALEAVPML